MVAARCRAAVLDLSQSVAPLNKYLARSNKSCMGIPATPLPFHWRRFVRSLAAAGIVIVLWLTTAVQARAEGDELLDYCSATEGYSLGVCRGYIMGVTETAPNCMPRVTLRQIKDVVVRYLQTNPQNRQRKATDLIQEAVNQAWPCPGGVWVPE
jgi:hypothetical protein